MSAADNISDERRRGHAADASGCRRRQSRCCECSSHALHVVVVRFGRSGCAHQSSRIRRVDGQWLRRISVGHAEEGRRATAAGVTARSDNADRADQAKTTNWHENVHQQPCAAAMPTHVLLMLSGTPHRRPANHRRRRIGRALGSAAVSPFLSCDSCSRATSSPFLLHSPVHVRVCATSGGDWRNERRAERRPRGPPVHRRVSAPAVTAAASRAEPSGAQQKQQQRHSRRMTEKKGRRNKKGRQFV